MVTGVRRRVPGDHRGGRGNSFPRGQAAAFGVLKVGREIHVMNETQVHAQLPSSALHRGCHRRGTGDPRPARPALPGPGTRGPELGSSLSGGNRNSRGPASGPLPAPVGRGRGQLRVSGGEISAAFPPLLPHFGSIPVNGRRDATVGASLAREACPWMCPLLSGDTSTFSCPFQLSSHEPHQAHSLPSRLLRPSPHHQKGIPKDCGCG